MLFGVSAAGAAALLLSRPRTVVAQAAATDGPLTQVEAQRRGRGLDVIAQARVEAPRSLIWATITDYDRLAEFVPGISSSRVVERQGNTVRVRQTGRANLLIFGFDVEVLIDAIESPPDSVEARLVSGSLRRLEGRYRIEPSRAAGRYNLRWEGVVEPGDDVPAFIGRAVALSTIEAQFAAMAAEINRRAAERERDAPRS